MGTYWSLPLVALAVILQATVIPQIRILGGQPDLIFLMTLSWSIHGRLEQSVTWAFVGGIVQDLMSAAPLGTSTLGLILLVFGVELIKQQVYSIGFLLLGALVVGGTILIKVSQILVLSMTGFNAPLGENFLYVIVPSIAYNLVFMAPVYWVMRRIQRRATTRQRGITS
jgi:rod shape-determining protein MreD